MKTTTVVSDECRYMVATPGDTGNYPRRFHPRHFPAVEIAEALTLIEGLAPAYLNLELLRETIEWARKSYEAPDSQSFKWDQEKWLVTDAPMVELMIDAKTREENDLGYCYDDNETLYYMVADGFCDTAGCIAGNIALKNGTPLFYKDELRSDKSYTADQMITGETIEQFARNELGLTLGEANLLFEGENVYDDIVRVAEAICIRRGLTY